MATVIRMPQLAAGGGTAAVQAWLVEPGDAVATGQPIAEIETEKAVVEYEAEVAGVFAGALAESGKWYATGSPIAVIAEPGEALDSALAEGGGPPPEKTIAVAEAAKTDPRSEMIGAADTSVSDAANQRTHRVFVTPLVRRVAAERNIPVRDIAGTGPNGRITRRDLDAYTQRQKSRTDTPADEAAPAVARPFEPATPDVSYTDVPHSGMRRAIARRLSESKSSVPHFYLVADVIVDDLLALRARINEDAQARISVNDFVLKAVACALRDVPGANATWMDDATRQFDEVDLAVAVSVPNGLVTPVLRKADTLSLGVISATVREFAERAREGRIKQHELEGGSFAVSNLGMYGTREFAAIINPPHAGILAVGSATKRPVVTGEGGIAVSTVMTVTLSADHRVLDGALAAQWLAAFVKRIENPLTILV